MPKLTKSVCEKAAATGKGWSILWDSAQPGLGLRVRASGTKTWTLSYRTKTGTKRLLTLGRWPTLTVDQARAAARQHKAAVHGGSDPLEEQRRARRASCFADLCREWLEKHAKQQRRRWRMAERTIERVLVPAWGSRKAEKITRGDVALLHARVSVESGPCAANHAGGLASALFTFGERMGLLPEGHPNPCRGLKRNPEQPRERWLSPDEVHRLIEVIHADPDVYIRTYFLASLLLGLRGAELRAARWDWIDAERWTLNLPPASMKAGRAHSLPLARPVRELLAQLPREAGNPHLFPGRWAGSHIGYTHVHDSWERLREASGLQDVTPHDLRRTVGSWLAQAGVPLLTIGKALAHTTPGVTAIYARLGEDHLRAPMEEHAARILAAGLPVEPQP